MQNFANEMIQQILTTPITHNSPNIPVISFHTPSIFCLTLSTMFQKG